MSEHLSDTPSDTLSENPDDRTTREPVADDLPDFRGGEGIRRVPDGADRPPRQRNLRPAFRPVPGIIDDRASRPDHASRPAASDPGFPGTRAFSQPSRPADRRAAGIPLDPAPGRADSAPAPAPRAGDLEGWRAAIQPGDQPAAAAVGSAIAADQGAGRGRIRGRVGRAADAADAASRAGTASLKEKPVKAGPAGPASPADPPALSLARPPARPPALPKAIAKLVGKDEVGVQVDPANPTRAIPSEAARADARRLFREIGEKFNENRKRSKTAAYAGYRHDLMANLDTLVMGGALDLKDATTIITNLEQYTRETEQESTETPAAILGRWLRMRPEEVGELERAGAGAGEAEGSSSDAGEEIEEDVGEEESGDVIDELDAAADPGDDGDSETIA